ncbi:MFS transporter [Devosia nitrariae]|uniref:MFS transporter n=1 Tax=Devosia nitrariae TaxID=2071872 RepID=A0ABQ5WDD5_9HYPH|nr:MFS transporter [Devosia nitrariae]GLQ58104.1 MFS transporter [Devosia nitrariae]
MTGSVDPQTRIAIVFLLQAITAGALFTRVPDIQAGLALSEAALGVALIGQPVGNLATLFVASAVLEHAGTRRIMLFGLPMLAICAGLAAVAPNSIALFAVFLVYGSAFALTNLAMNVEADRSEAAVGRRFMNRCHGVASAGLLLTSLFGAVLRGAGVAPSEHLVLMTVPIGVGALALILPLQPAPPRLHDGTRPRRFIAIPTMMTLLLVGFVLSGVLLEGGARAWSIIYMRDSFTAPDWLDSLALSAFLATMAVGRLLADGWTERYGPPTVARALMALACLGLLIVVLAPVPIAALFGFALIGLGTSVIYPLTLSAAARLKDRPSSENVAAVTMASSMIVLAAPAVLGSIATHYGIRMTFAVLVPATMLSFALAFVLSPKRD